MNKFVDIFAVFFFIWIAVTITFLSIWMINYQKYKPMCLDAGYAVTEITWTLDAYCISADGTKVDLLKGVRE